MRGANVLTLRRANVFRICGSWQHEDYDVFDGERDVGRVYLVDHRAFQVPAALERSTATAVPPDRNERDTECAWTQEKSTRYEPPAINFHLEET
jgi:hypothetical protein